MNELYQKLKSERQDIMELIQCRFNTNEFDVWQDKGYCVSIIDKSEIDKGQQFRWDFRTISETEFHKLFKRELESRQVK